MALYNINVDGPGGKKALGSESVPPSSSSNLVHLLQVVLDPAYVQDSLDGYVPCESNASTTSVVFNAPFDIKANQFRGEWIWVNHPTAEIRVVQSNTAATDGNPVTVTVAQPFDSAPTVGASCIIRQWEDWYIPALVGSVNEFAAKFLTTGTDGKPDWTNTRAAYAQLRKLFANGARFVWVVPVEQHDNVDDLVAALDPEYNAVGANRLLSLAPMPSIVVNPKHPQLKSGSGSVLSDAQMASTDSAWIAYIQSRATNSAVDEKLTEMVYVCDSGYADTASAVTYVTSSVNTTEPRVFWVHGQHLSNSEVAGEQMVDSPATAWAGMINRISVTSPQSFGHSLYGERWTQLALNEGGLVEKNQTPTNRTQLRNAGINFFRTVAGKGTFVESGNFTAAKNSSSSGLDPEENCHVIVTRAKIWNDLQPILGSLVSEANTPLNRAKLEGQISGYMNSLKAQNVVEDYTLTGTTTSADILAKTARFELRVYSAGVVDFVELKLVSSFAS